MTKDDVLKEIIAPIAAILNEQRAISVGMSHNELSHWPAMNCRLTGLGESAIVASDDEESIDRTVVGTGLWNVTPDPNHYERLREEAIAAELHRRAQRIVDRVVAEAMEKVRETRKTGSKTRES